MGEVDNYKDGPPWIFKGRAVYQLHLVKTEVARHFIPPELAIVEAFGYTLGGLYFAEYESSPAGRFSELVALAGTVWNPPASCGWAAQVLVDSQPARDHGITDVGLPSRLASFTAATVSPALDNFQKARRQRKHLEAALLDVETFRHKTPSVRRAIDVSHSNGARRHPLCRLLLPCANKGLPAVPVSMSLPSFSGRTKLQPELLNYWCSLKCRLRVIPPITVENNKVGDAEATLDHGHPREDKSGDGISVQAVLLSRPVMALEFSDMIMSVPKPVPVGIQNRSHTPLGKTSTGGPIPAGA